MDTPESINGIGNGSVLIAFATIFGYACAYVFKYTYLSYYGIPIPLIEIEISDILLSIILVLLVGVVSLGFIDAIFHLPFIKGSQRGKIRGALLIILFLVLFGAVLVDTVLARVILIGIITTAILFHEFIAPLFFGGKGKTRNERVNAYERFLEEHAQRESQKQECSRNTDEKRLLSVVINYVERNKILPLRLLITGVLALYLSLGLGYLYAFQRVQYEVFNTEPPLVLIDTFNHYLIAVPFDRGCNSFTAKIELLDIDSLYQQGLSLTIEKIKKAKRAEILLHQSIFSKLIHQRRCPKN